MAANPISLHAAECISDCVSAIRTWREAVREVNARFDTLRLNHERDCFAHMNSFHPSVVAEAESYVHRSAK
jgi:hypothetical protein